MKTNTGLMLSSRQNLSLNASFLKHKEYLFSLLRFLNELFDVINDDPFLTPACITDYKNWEI